MKISSFLLLAGTILVIGAALDSSFRRQAHDSTEDLLDKGLDDTFPASDPTSTQDFSSPEDRGQAPRGYAR